MEPRALQLTSTEKTRSIKTLAAQLGCCW